MCAPSGTSAFSGASFETVVGAMTFDGNGNLVVSGTDYNRVPDVITLPNGTICSPPFGPPTTMTTSGATYTVNADGTGTMNMNDGDLPYSFIIGGTTANGIVRSTILFNTGANNQGLPSAANPGLHNTGTGTAVLQ